jgi:hypothetical protein
MYVSSYAEEAVNKRFACVAALLRMGTKYDVPLFRKLALGKLRALSPATWDELATRKESNAIVADFDNRMAPALLAIAIAYGVPAGLPFAMWWAMPTCSDRGAARALAEPCAIGDGRAYVLEPHTVHGLLLGAWRCAERLMQAALKSFRASPNCTASGACGPVLAGRLAASAIPRVMVREIILRFKQLSVIRRAEGERSFTEEVCEQCYKDATAAWEDERRKNWETLPSLFDLEPWDVLLAVSD